MMPQARVASFYQSGVEDTLDSLRDWKAGTHAGDCRCEICGIMAETPALAPAEDKTEQEDTA